MLEKDTMTDFRQTLKNTGADTFVPAKRDPTSDPNSRVMTGPHLDAEKFIRFFENISPDLYGEGLRSRWRNQSYNWQPPAQALKQVIGAPWEGSSHWEGLKHQIHIPYTLHKLREWGVREISFIAHGWNNCTGAIFDADFHDGGVPQTIALGIAPAEKDFFAMRWSPIVLQPFEQASISSRHNGQNYNFSIRRIAVGEMVDTLLRENDPYPPQDFGKYMNEKILYGSPFEVTGLFDLHILNDGTPIFAGWDPIRIRSEHGAEHVCRQWDQDYQQMVMAQIHGNCVRAGWPGHLCPVVETTPGVFMTKQSFLHPDPFTKANKPAVEAGTGVALPAPQ